MSSDRKIEKIKEILRKGKEKNCLINPSVLLAIIENEFKCLCKVNTECPCNFEEDLVRLGRCYCGLYIKGKTE